MATIQWRDIDVWLRQKRDGDILVMDNVDAVINSLRNILLTNPGSRRMLPDFASKIYKLLFEPQDDVTASLLRDAILESIRKWEDRISLKTVSVIPDYEKQIYTVNIIFSLKSASSEVYSLTQVLEAR